jgi:hypothetical protein
VDRAADIGFGLVFLSLGIANLVAGFILLFSFAVGFPTAMDDAGWASWCIFSLPITLWLEYGEPPAGLHQRWKRWR